MWTNRKLALTTPTASPDARHWLARPDLAELALEGRVPARAYAPTRALFGIVPVAEVFDGHGPAAARISQLLFGEIFDVLDEAGSRLWGRCRRDGVVGWIDADAAAGGAHVPTHRVASIGGVLPLNALVDPARDAVGDVTLMPIGQFEPDLAVTAQRMLGTPHAPGGRSDRDTDCAGLVQACLIACGRAAPRLADEQAELGRAVEADQVASDDLAIWTHPVGGPGWTGHAAILLDGETVIHASGAAGRVVIECLGAVDARMRQDGFDAPRFRRL